MKCFDLTWWHDIDWIHIFVEPLFYVKMRNFRKFVSVHLTYYMLVYRWCNANFCRYTKSEHQFRYRTSTKNSMCGDRSREFYDVLLGTFYVCCFDKVNSFYGRWNLSWGSQLRLTGQIQNSHTIKHGETVQMHTHTHCTIYSSILSIYFTIESFSETDVPVVPVVVSCVKLLRMSMVTLILNLKENQISQSNPVRRQFFLQSKLCIVTALFCGFWNLNWIELILFGCFNERAYQR